jgi:hypothetical protein
MLDAAQWASICSIPYREARIHSVMDQELYRGFAQRARDLTDKADPITRKRLLDFAAGYDVKVGRSRPASTFAEWPLRRTVPPASPLAGSTEA